jgi:hypothetical protein
MSSKLFIGPIMAERCVDCGYGIVRTIPVRIGEADGATRQTFAPVGGIPDLSGPR